MTVDDLLAEAKQSIHSDHAKLLLADLLNLNPLEMLMHLDDKVDNDIITKYRNEVRGLKMGKPLQYVMGYTNFYGNKFIVNENVLIPRFETEELVENLINLTNKYFKDNIDIIDLGCGSGAIGLTLKKNIKNANIDMLDISEKALEVTKENAKSLSLDVNFIQGDMLEKSTKKYDIIVSNPPYIKEDEEIEPIVKNNEPSLALYAGKDGLIYYDKILKRAKDSLKEKFIIAFEIGADEKEDIINLVNKYLNDVTVIDKKDMQGRDRMLFIISNNLLNKN